MAKKILATLFAAMMILALLAACVGGGNDGTGGTSNGGTGSGQTNDVNKETYELRYSGFSASGSATNLCMEEGIKSYIENLSGGRITVTIYNAGSLTSQGSTLQGIIDGTTDAGMDIPDIYSGVYPYLNLYCAPGINYGDWESQQQIVLDYVSAYPDVNMTDNFFVLAYQPVSQQGIVSSEPITEFDQFKGLSMRCTSAKLDFYNAIGAAPVVLSTGDVFESMRLNVIDASTNSLLATANYAFYELVDFFSANAYDVGCGVIAFSLDYYNDMDAEAQGWMDKLASYVQGTLSAADNKAQYEAALKVIEENNPDFKVTEFSTDCLQKMADAAAPLLDSMAANLDSRGLDGTGALEWLRAHAVPLS